MWVIVDNQPVADVARPATVRSDGFRRTPEPLLEEISDRMAFRPEVVNFAALAMVVGAARRDSSRLQAEEDVNFDSYVLSVMINLICVGKDTLAYQEVGLGRMRD